MAVTLQASRPGRHGDAGYERCAMRAWHGGGVGRARGGVAAPDAAQGERQRDRRAGHRGGVPQRTQWSSGSRNYEVRSYISGEASRKGRRNWQGKSEEQRAVCMPGSSGGYAAATARARLRRRGEMVERSFAHCYETGGMRRCHLRGRENILKRQLIHVGAFNLSLVMRKLLGAGTPRELRNRFAMLVVRILLLLWQGNGRNHFCGRVAASVGDPLHHRAPSAADRLAENQLVAPRAAYLTGS